MIQLLIIFLNSLIHSPFASITTDIGPTLLSVMEKEKLKDACKDYFKSPNEINERLCGKSIFFNLETKTDLGIPNQMLEQVKKTFPEDFSQVGFYGDPTNPKEVFGVVKVKPLYPEKLKELLSLNNIRQISCAGCHVGQMPDGRWSVGYPNYNLNVGKLNSLFAFPLWLADENKDDPNRWLPELSDKFKKMRSLAFKNPLKSWMLIVSSLPGRLKLSRFFYRFLEQDPPSLGDQRSYLYGRPGVYNAASPIISFGEREFYTTPPQIWDLDHKDPSDEAYLGTITSVDNLEDFIKHAYAYTTLTSKYALKDSKQDYIRPLASYLRSLKTPKYLGKIDHFRAKKGKQLFKTKCFSCHDGRNGASKIRYSVETVKSPKEIDSIFKDYLTPSQQSTKLMTALQESSPFDPITFGIKARRLNGIWSKKSIMTNGSITSLDHLFCLKGKERVLSRRPAQTENVHADLCNLENTEKLELKEYLKTL